MPISLAFEKYTLSNGLDVILHEDHSIPVVAVNLWYHVGSQNEEPERTGFAHLFEHLMFEGSKHHNREYFMPLQEVGANINGSTSTDRTNYYENVPSEYLELALWLESDRMGFLLDAVDQPRLDLQRDVVKNERRQSYDNRPYGRAGETISRALLTADHPYSWPVIGSMTDLSNATLEDVKNFFRKWYTPNNAALAIAGDFDRSQVKAWIEQYFGSIPRGPAIERRTSVPPARIARDTFIVLEDKVQLPRVYYAWQSPKFFAPGDAELDLISQVLAGDKSSRLYRRLVYELQIAQDVSASQASRRLDG